MPKKTYYICFFVCFLCSFAISAQIDESKGEIKKGVKKSITAVSGKEVKKPTVLESKDKKSGFKNAYDKSQQEKEKKQREKDLEEKGILSKAKIAEERFLNSYTKINARYSKIDQDLGSFRTQSKNIKIVCRDFQYPDGDRVTILVNNIPVVYNITLRRAYQVFTIPLQKGINKIAFKALNQGTSGPNTAGFKVYDESGNLISSNEWNLATGAKATLLIAKDK
ncbi:MAG: hypothetical protein GKR88_06195 [Flavobacteriaceae bacterium]|nr:MAG: hypothetical protein GKR88_06195 [Flavobacteriaceae bacterium]